MRSPWARASADPRREAPRIDVLDASCWELIDGHETNGMVLDLSSGGVRLERPYLGGPCWRDAPLHLEVPELDEVVWARAEVTFDQVVPTASKTRGGPFGLVRQTGYRIVAAASRDLRQLHDYVFDTHHARLKHALYSAR